MTDALDRSEFPPDLANDDAPAGWAKAAPVGHTAEAASAGGWLAQAWHLWARPEPVHPDGTAALPPDPAF